MKNNTELLFLGWMILAHVSDGWHAVGAAVFACGYALYGIYEVWSNRK
jgi:hypothetical protein